MNNLYSEEESKTILLDSYVEVQSLRKVILELREEMQLLVQENNRFLASISEIREQLMKDISAQVQAHFDAYLKELGKSALNDKHQHTTQPTKSKKRGWFG